MYVYNQTNNWCLDTQKHDSSLLIKSAQTANSPFKKKKKERENFTLIIQAKHIYSSWYFDKWINFIADINVNHRPGLSSCNITDIDIIYFIFPTSAHLGREWEWSTGSCHKHSGFIV